MHVWAVLLAPLTRMLSAVQATPKTVARKVAPKPTKKTPTKKAPTKKKPTNKPQSQQRLFLPVG